MKKVMTNSRKSQSGSKKKEDISAASLPCMRILGSRIYMIDIPALVAIIDVWISKNKKSPKCRQIVVTGFHGLWVAHQRADVKTVLNSAEIWVPDGIAPAWIARLKGMKAAVRTPGADIMKAYFELADRKGFRSYFYGDTDHTLAELKTNLEEKYPGHICAGTYSPPFRKLTPEEDKKIIRMINEAKPDVLWVGLGLPKQDIWIHERKDLLKVPIAIGVGAAFSFHAGTVKRVPEWIGNIGMEWLWRLLKEPRKLWRRALIDGPQFVWHVALELSGLRKY
jgi:N-acetylglucosaminyldiphosphoundecaprenol N-acetyl-beta-D-mannosaminyltransferase